jgi:spore coat protein U-like protein
MGGPIPACPFSGRWLAMSTKRTSSRPFGLAMAAFALAAGAPAIAQPGDADASVGTATVSVVEPIGIQRVADLRFGRIIQPTANGTLTLAFDGTLTEAGGVVGLSSTPQAINGRGPGAFAVFGDPNRRFIAFMPNSTVITSGANAMVVNQFQANPGGFPGIFRRFDANGFAPLFIGGRLNINANQATGTYTGTYDVTVLYL